MRPSTRRKSVTERRRIRTLAATVALVGVTIVLTAHTVSADPSTSPGVASWSDHLHGWIVTTTTNRAGLEYPRIASTDNGGKSWATIYRSPFPGTLRAILRTSPSVGLAALSVLVNHREVTSNRMIATFNNGKSWQRLPGRDYWEYMNGSGHDLFVAGNPDRSSTNPTTLYRVTNWPSLNPQLYAQATVAADFYAFDGPDLRLVPGGVAALELADNSALPFALLVDHNGATRLSRPPSVDDTSATLCGIPSFAIDWPSVTIVTDWALLRPQGQASCVAPLKPVVYLSGDAGRTWRVIGAPPSTSPTATTTTTAHVAR